MKPREVFQLAIKIVGFIVLLQGLRNSVEGLLILTGYANTRLSTPQYWAAWALIKTAVGLYLMMGTTPFLNLAFPLKAEPKNQAAEPPPNADQPQVIKEIARFVNSRVIFDLIVRTIGLVVLLYGLEYLVDALLYAMKTPEAQERSNHGWALFSLIQVAVGLALLRGLMPLADFAFPVQTGNEQPKVEGDLSQNKDRE